MDINTRDYYKKAFSDLLDPAVYSDEIPTEVVHGKDKDGKKYKVQKGWFNAISANLYLIKNEKVGLLSEDVLKQINDFDRILFKLRKQYLTTQDDIDRARLLIKRMLDELTI